MSSAGREDLGLGGDTGHDEKAWRVDGYSQVIKRSQGTSYLVRSTSHLFIRTDLSETFLFSESLVGVYIATLDQDLPPVQRSILNQFDIP